MWNNYFAQIRKKYSMRVSQKNPLVINLDGKDATKNKMLNLLINHENGFLQNMQRTVEFFTRKYNCISIFGADEVSFIFLNPTKLVSDLNSDKNYYSNEILAVFSQYFFDYFNNETSKEKIFWHGKCFSIPEDKLASYIKYRSGIIKNVMVTYFAKVNRVNNDLGLEEKVQMCKTLPGYDDFSEIQDGILFFGGMKIDLDEFIVNGVKEEVMSDDKADAEIFVDLDDIDIEMLWGAEYE